jgi:N-acetylmuramoyl-L-alanine amidase
MFDARPLAFLPLRAGAAVVAAAAVFALSTPGWGQAPAPRPPNAFTVLTSDGRYSLPTTVVNGQDVVALDDLARLFQLTVREDAVAGGLNLTSAAGKSLVLSTTQGLASAGGRLVSLSGPPVKQARGWAVPLDAVSRALPLLVDTRIELRRESRLVVVGDIRVPRVFARLEPQPGQLRVIVDISPTVPHSIEQQPGRLVVRFQADAIDATLAASSTPDLLGSIRVLESGTAVALELGPAFASFRASDQPGARDATRLTIELMSNAVPAPPAAPSASAAPPPGVPVPEPPPLFEPPTSALRTIVLDPGHGGDETGAKGAGGTFEKDVALGVARQLKALLESRLGVRVLLTRDGDQMVPLDQRAAQANNNKADVFVSLHANASVRSAARGAEVFYLSAGEYNAEARQQAALEGEALPVVSGGDRRVEMILWEMAQLQHLEDSATLATLIERQLRDRVPMNAAAIQQAPFRVLVGANMPAVLVELGFVTNPDEEKLLASAAHQAVLAQALYESLLRFRAYLENGRRPLAAEGLPAGSAAMPRSPGAAPHGGR